MPSPSRFVWEFTPLSNTASCNHACPAQTGIFCPFGGNYSSSSPLCHTCKVLLPSSSADIEVTLTFVRKCADFTCPSSVLKHQWLLCHWLFTFFLLYDFTEVTVSISIPRNLEKSQVMLMILKCVLESL